MVFKCASDIHYWSNLKYKTVALVRFLTSLISLILEPPLPISDPHWLAGTTNRNVTGGLGTVGVFCRSCKTKAFCKSWKKQKGNTPWITCSKYKIMHNKNKITMPHFTEYKFACFFLISKRCLLAIQSN